MDLSTKTSNRRRKQKNPKRKKDETEDYLEELVLGDAEDVLEKLDESYTDDWSSKETKHSQTKISKGKEQEALGKRKPAWVDNDEDESKRKKEKDSKPSVSSTKTYSEELQNRYMNITGTPSWADLNKKEPSKGSEDEDDLSTRVGNYIIKSNTLPKEKIDVKLCKPFGTDSQELGCITSVEFHPTAQVALTAGLFRKAILYQVDGVKNQHIQSVLFEHFPISCAHFTANGEEFVVGSNQHKHFFTYDMMAGKIIKIPWKKGMEELQMKNFFISPEGKYIVAPGLGGYMHFLSAKNKEWLYSLKMNSKVRGVAFNADGNQMYSNSDNGDVYLWDMKTRDCIHKFCDDGCIRATTIALSPNQQYLACGSNTGVVNIYDTNSLTSSSNPKPLKAIYNLTTNTSCLKFNCTSEILAMCSPAKENAVKLVHLPSLEVFQNFPSSKWKVGSVTSLDISLNSGFLAACTTRGTSHLFRLNYYGSF